MPHAPARPFAGRSARTLRAAALILMLALAAAAAHAQDTYTTNATDGKTPAAMAPGAPAGSYALSGFDNINLYSRSLNFRLPLLTVGGRGSAGYTMTLPIERKWSVNHKVEDTTPPGCHPFPNCERFLPVHSYEPTSEWYTDLTPGFGPGVLLVRPAGSKPASISGCGLQPTTTLTRLTFVAPGGTEYELRDVKYGGAPKPRVGCNLGVDRGKVFVTADGSAATFVSDTPIIDMVIVGNDDYGVWNLVRGTMYLRDGTRYGVVDGHVEWIRDRNGNETRYYAPSPSHPSQPTKAVDSLGREVTINGDAQLTYKGFGGAERTISVLRDMLSNRMRPANAEHGAETVKTFGALFPTLLALESSNTEYMALLFDVQLASAVVLPDGRSFQLYYNSYGELARVELPTGGAFEYDYEPGEGVRFGAGGYQIFRRVTERRVYDGAGRLEGVTTFGDCAPAAGPTNTCVEVDQLDPHPGEAPSSCAEPVAGRRLVSRTRHYFYGNPVPGLYADATDYVAWDEGKEFRTEAYACDGTTLLRTTEQTWRQRAQVDWWENYNPVTRGPEPSNDPRLVTTVTADDPGGANLVSKVTSVDPRDATGQTIGFDRYNNPTDVWEYDFGAGQAPAHPTRHTQTDYLTTNAVGGSTYDYACDPSTTCSLAGVGSDPNLIHQRGLPVGRRVYAVNPSTGAETIVARSETRYDEAAYAPLTYVGVTVPGWAGPATPARGSATSARSFADASASVGPTQACPAGVCVETHARYDQLGNLRRSWDARDNLSEMFYNDSFCNGEGLGCDGTYTANTFAFPTLTKSPKPDPSGTYGSADELTSSTVYDFYTGFAHKTTDANNEVTGFEYEGGSNQLGRLKAVVRPDGGRTDYEYGDTPGDLYLVVRTDLDGSRETLSKQFFDGLGRAYRSATYENSVPATPWLNVDTAYDSQGRAVTASMPYRSAGGGTPLTPEAWANVRRAETEFDALGRVAKVTTRPDGAAVSTRYSGARVLVTDQDGRQRISRTDGLGRLREVWEITPNDTGQYPGVESIPSTITSGLLDSAYGYGTEYFYDTLGNLRRVKQGMQQRFFAYDSLGRLVRARNPEQGSFTPDAAGGDFPALVDSTSDVNNDQWSMGYLYDANGNLTKRRDARGTTAAYGYDALNRNITVTYTTPSGSGAATTPNVKRYYDNSETTTNGLGRPWWTETVGLSATYIDSYDAVGRPKQQTQKFWKETTWEQAPAYVTNLEYNKAGGVTKLIYPSQHAVEYQYDTMGRLGDNGTSPAFKGTLGDNAERTYASQVLYDELGGMSQEMFGTQTPVYNKRLYNARGQLGEIRVSTYAITNADQGLRTNWNRGAIINHYSVSGGGASGGGSDNNGNLRRQEIFIPKIDGAGYDQASNHDVFTQNFDYDDLNRLKRAEEAWGGQTRWAQAYDYDRWGNRTVNAAGTWLGQSSAPPSELVNEKQFDKGDLPDTNRLYAPGDTALLMSQRRMRYDAVGNLTHDQYMGKGLREYDAENRMTKAADESGGTTSYAYDADGRRVKRLAGSAGEVWQVYGAGGELLAEYAKDAPSNAPRKEYGYRGGELLVTAEAAAAGWGAAPDFYENPLNPNHSEKTPIRSRHITELRDAIDALRAHKGLPGYGWLAPAGVHDPVTIDPITEMRAALNEALGAPMGGYSAGLAQWQPILAIHIQELRQRVLDAWQTGGGGVDIRWLVSDQLGTPRMVVDKTGSLTSPDGLSGMRRHDYLPFGEELAAGAGGRIPELGYSQSDGNRKKWAKLERDDETGLDYAQARYYSSVQGRFVSTDPLMASASAISPQTWNRYTYAYNNPLRFSDPNGMLASDFYSEDGKRIGTDGVNNGKLYLVPDEKQAKQIEKTNKAGGTTQVSAVSSALELPEYNVRQEIGVAAVTRSNQPNGTDPVGEQHEEGGLVIATANGQLAVPANPGLPINPLSGNPATVDVFNAQNPQLLNQASDTTANPETSYHVHPRGKVSTTSNTSTSGGGTSVFGSAQTRTGKFNQSPTGSPTDFAFGANTPTRLGYHIVVGARDQKVYFYTNRVLGTMPLDKFVSIK